MINSSRYRRFALLLLFSFFAIGWLVPPSGEVSAATPSGKPQEELLFNGVKILESAQGISLVIRLESTARGDYIPENAFTRHFSIHPMVPIRLLVRPDGFLLSGNFQPGTQYRLEISGGLKSLKGAVLKRKVSASIKIPLPSPHLSFLVKGRYVGRGGDLRIPVRMVHVQKTFLSLSRVPERNLPIWESYDRWDKHNLEEILIQKASIVLKPVGKGIFILNLASFLPPHPSGLYRVVLSGCQGKGKIRRCSRDEMFLVVTDLGLVVKTTPKRIYTWVIHLPDGHPLSGVSVWGYSNRNLLMGKGVTDREGACSFSYNRKAVGLPYVVVARFGQDTTYLPLRATRVDTAPFHVGGRNILSTPYLSAFVLEKDLYRPGETLHYAILLRETQSYRGVALPVVIRFRDPKGRVLMTQRAMTDSLGLASFALHIPAEAMTGDYTLELVIGEKVLKTQGIYVEDFVPERVKITLKPRHPLFTSWKRVQVTLKARYLFGAPVSGGGYRVTWAGTPVRKGLYRDYLFGPVKLPGETGKAPPLWQQRGTLNDEGTASLTPPAPFPGGRKAPWRLIVKTEVKEAGSERVSRRETSLSLRLAPLYPGLRLTALTPCHRARISGVVVDAEGRRLNGETTLRYALYRVDTRYVLAYSPQGNRRWERTVSRVPLSGPTPLKVANGKFRIPVEIKRCWDDYLVAVWDPKGGARSELVVPGWREGKNRPPTPEILKISLSAREVTPGSRVTAETLLPFPGNVLWTLELGDVKSFHWENSKGKKATFTFTVPGGESTLYITAFLYQTRPGYLVTRAFGIRRLRVVPAKVRAPVSISVPKKIQPRTTLKIKVKGPAGGKAMVAVVDEGVLQITHFASPDLYNFLLSPFRLSVVTSEGLGWILPRFQLLPGGGEAYAMATKIKPQPKPRFYRTFSFWKVVSIPAGGRVEIPVKVSRYEGALRIMVSVVGENGFASAHAFVKVASPVVVQPTLPRLLRQGDKVQVPVFLSNTTHRDLKVDVQVTAGKLPRHQTVTLHAYTSKTLFFTLHPKAFFGNWPVDIQATYRGRRWHDTYNLRLLPALPRSLQSRMFKVEKGDRFSLTSRLEEWAPQDLKLSILASSSPLFGGLRHVKRLLAYPYGCLEQTSSTLLTLIHLLPFMKTLNPAQGNIAKIQARVRAGVIRLIKMQTDWGGFTFWPGGGNPHPWGSTYATFALLETRDAGFYVPPVVIDRAVNFLRNLDPNPWRDFVLARAKHFRPRGYRRSGKARILSQEALLLKAGTFYYAGYPERARQILKRASRAPARVRIRHETFFSPLRLLALKLYMTDLIAPHNPQIPLMALDLLTQLNAKRAEGNYSTQELAWSMVALGRYLRFIRPSPLEAHLQSKGKEVPPASALSGVLSWHLNGPGASPLIFWVSRPKTAWVSLTIDGYRTSGFHPVKNKGLGVASRFVTQTGKVIKKLHPGSVFVYDILLKNTSPDTLRHLAIRVPMVAGLEVINPRLFPQRAPRWIRKGETFKTRYADVRDEEVDLFGNLSKGTHHAFLLMRATFRFEGTLPPIRAEVMYRPWIHAMGGMRLIKVQ